jgi:hypothetical protein
MPKAPKGKRHVASDGTITVRGKAANGEAAPYFRKGREVWVATYMVDGKPKVVEAKTQALATERRNLATARHRPRNGSTLTPATTVIELVEWWLEHFYRQRVRASSYGAKQNQLSRLRLAAIADVTVANLTTEQVIRWRTDVWGMRLAPVERCSVIHRDKWSGDAEGCSRTVRPVWKRWTKPLRCSWPQSSSPSVSSPMCSVSTFVVLTY